MRLLPEAGGRVQRCAGVLAGAPELVVEVSDSENQSVVNLFIRRQ